MPDRPHRHADAAPLETIARGLLRIPVVHQGRTRAGVDCAGGVALLYAADGRVALELPTGYKVDWFRSYPGRMRDHIEQQLGWTRVRGEARPLDLLLFGVLTAEGEHPAVFLGGGRFFHVWNGATTITEMEDRWMRRLVSVYRPVRSSACPKHSPSC